VTPYFYLNGHKTSLPEKPMFLIDMLRQEKKTTATKAACREGDCGSCQVLVGAACNGVFASFNSQISCLLRTEDLANCHVITIEGLEEENIIQKTLSKQGASQCGYCSPGLVMGVLNWLLNGETLSADEGYAYINANLCRCTGYMGQKRAIRALVESLSQPLLNGSDRFSTLLNLNIFKQNFSALANQAQQNNHPSSDDPINVCISGGGTDLALRDQADYFEAVSVLKSNPENVIKIDGDYLRLSARHPVQVVEDALKRAKQFSEFSSFINVFASIPIRNRATLGGNLANASPVADGICFFTSLEAIIETSQRNIAIDKLYDGRKRSTLKPKEIIEWITLPRDIETFYIYFDKVSRRGARDIASVNCCSAWEIKNKQVFQARITLGGASPMPVRLHAIEQALVGCSLSSDISAIISDKLKTIITPISDIRGSAAYRLLLAQQLLLSQWQALSDECLHEGNHVKGK
jgi:xanthine dehydrogenase small subunit